MAPGTVGTLAAALVVWGIGTGPWLWVLISLGMTAGIAVLGRFEREVGEKDPPAAVLDEVIGYWCGVLALPMPAHLLVASFVLFRVFDIVKPFPAKHAESLPGGWGILLDDLVAAAYTQLVIRGGLYLT